MALRKLLAALFAFTLIVGFTACSSDDKKESTDTEDTTDDAADEDASEPADEDETDDTSLADLDEELGDLGDLGDLGGLGDCLNVSLAYAGIFLGSLAAIGGDEAAYEEFLAEIEEIDAQIPEEISEEFGIVAEAYSDYFAELSDGNLDAEDPLSADEDVAAADAAITDYLESEACNLG